jgi:uncharacterized protein (TIGR02265 family)
MLQSHAVLPAAAEQLELERRLSATPPSACVRGVFFNMITDHLKRSGRYDAARRALGPRARRRIHLLYPVSDFLVESALAAPFIHEDPDEAMRQMWAGAAVYFATTWLGRAFQRFIRPDPASALDWIENGREHSCNYGQWRCEHVERNHVVLHMFDEYIWIGSAHRGGCEGLLAACGVKGEVTASAESLFRGRLDVRWQLRD